MLVLIIDDEELAREHLRALLSRHLDVVVAGEASSGAEGLQLIRNCPCQLVFMDIELGAHVMALAQPPGLVYLTAHADFSLQAFELGALDYLLKPVRRERLAVTLDRARATQRKHGSSRGQGGLEGGGRGAFGGVPVRKRAERGSNFAFAVRMAAFSTLDRLFWRPAWFSPR